jgi:hypothetical protein
MSAKFALENEYDYLLFIDDDVIVPLDTFEKLLAVDADIAAGWVIVRGHPFPNMFYKYDPEEKGALRDYIIERGEGLYDVDAVGFSCCLIKCSLLKRVPAPWFVTGPFNTEDIYFCLKAKQNFPDVTITVDASIECAHIMGPEVIAPWNRETYGKYYKDTFPELTVPPRNPLEDESGERANNYRNHVKALKSEEAYQETERYENP